MERHESRDRVLLFAPHGRDAELMRVVLSRAGYEGMVIDTPEALCEAVRHGAGCAVITEEALPPRTKSRLIEVLEAQPPWSDFPFVVLTAQSLEGRARSSEPLRVLGNVATLDRPVKARTLLSAVRIALRGRQRQYDARRAIEQRDQFLAMLGHELRNPLGAITLATELLQQAPAVSERAAKQHQIIHRQTRHLSRLVDDLLDVARVTTGKVVLERKRLELGELLRRCAEALKGMVESRQLSVSLRAAPDLFVDGDAVRLDQVFTNLLNNSIKYSSTGADIVIDGRVVAGWVEISIKDTGVGIAPHMLRGIFDLFMQAQSTLARSQGGMGIGLTLVRSLVELHGGTVEARSEGLGRGSEFVVRLPVASELEVRRVTREVPAQPPRGVRVVLIEDSEDIRETSRDALEALGCQVWAAADGPSGLATIFSTRPDLALVDIGLPGLDGYEVARRVRASLGNTIILVALTGYGLPSDQHRAHTAGFDTHLTKPVSLQVLEKALARAQEPSKWAATDFALGAG